MLPRAHTAWCFTSSLCELRRATSFGTAPAFTTAMVCSLAPDAMLVRDHVASYCMPGLPDNKQDNQEVQNDDGKICIPGKDSISIEVLSGLMAFESPAAASIA
ncbi:hypothetical protein B566_EDAN001042 [Ephemera danica]|nr:hypothetical protein B566_EDAN001042 [Ephemera danica]